MTNEKPIAIRARVAGTTSRWNLLVDDRLHYWEEGKKFPLCMEAGADVPGGYWGVRDRSRFTCQDCIEWIHG